MTLNKLIPQDKIRNHIEKYYDKYLDTLTLLNIFYNRMFLSKLKITSISIVINTFECNQLVTVIRQN